MTHLTLARCPNQHQGCLHPEVTPELALEKRTRRRFSVDRKLLTKADRCQCGDLSALPRREHLYSSAWKRAWKAANLPTEPGILKGVHILRPQAAISYIVGLDFVRRLLSNITVIRTPARPQRIRMSAQGRALPTFVQREFDNYLNTLHIEDALSGWHHACDLRATGFHCPTGGTGATAAR